MVNGDTTLTADVVDTTTAFTVTKEADTTPATTDIMFYLQFDNPATGTEITGPDIDAVYTVARQTVTYDSGAAEGTHPTTGTFAWDSAILFDLVPAEDYSLDTTDQADTENCPDQADSAAGDWV